MKKRSFGILLLFVIFVFTGCGGEKKKDKTELTMVLDWTPNTNHTGLYVAEKLGYFEDAGLKVDIIQPPESGATDLVASGNAQFGIDFQEYLAAAWGTDNPLPVTAVAAILQHNTSGLVSLAEEGIDSPEKLEGKRYATWEIPIEQGILENVVTTAGGDFDKVELVPAYVSDIVAGLNSDIDCVWIYYGWDGIKLELENIATNFILFKDINGIFDFYSPVIIANDDFLKENPDEARAFMQAVRKGYEYAAGHPDEAAEILLEYAPELDADMVKASQQYLSKQYVAEAKYWGIIDKDRWDSFYNWVNENGYVEKPIAGGTGFTNEYIE
ncbi:MAG: ABC transporter substrate-binding protein [Clostridium sp.]|nr:ABC transporter substrate-binding protein [Clostridium sp.]MCM1398717.1 ABC transporter substrate-binding protein [Clostridium sp.]MCM1458651.1 ABC transporter substrate-binding protein [Bacteroides sp.]